MFVPAHHLRRLNVAGAAAALALAAAGAAFGLETKPPPPLALDDIYTAQAVVTGKDERNRPLGFKLCFEDVLVRASGDVTILDNMCVSVLAVWAVVFFVL